MGSKPLSERLIHKLKNHPVIAVIIVCAVVLIGVGALFDSIDKTLKFFTTRFGQSIDSTSQDLKSKNDKHERSQDFKRTINDVITFDSRDPQKSKFTIGDCPSKNCYVFERGEIYTSNDGVKGHTFYLSGKGFINDAGTDELGRDIKLTEVATLNGQWGYHFSYPDGSSEYMWLNTNVQGYFNRDGLKTPEKIRMAVWVPLIKEYFTALTSKGRDITIIVVDDAINNLRISIEIAPGTFCTGSIGLGSITRLTACSEKGDG